jgi:hypothetical protein
MAHDQTFTIEHDEPIHSLRGELLAEIDELREALRGELVTDLDDIVARPLEAWPDSHGDVLAELLARPTDELVGSPDDPAPGEPV